MVTDYVVLHDPLIVTFHCRHCPYAFRWWLDFYQHEQAHAAEARVANAVHAVHHYFGFQVDD